MSVFREMAMDHGYDPDEWESYFEGVYRQMEAEAQWDAWYENEGWMGEMIFHNAISFYLLIQNMLLQPALISP